MKDLKFNIIEKINEETAQKLELFIATNKEALNKCENFYVFIDSPGGLVEAGKKILNLLTPYSEKLITVAISECSSIATFIFLLGKKRYIHKNCHFLMHRPVGANFPLNLDKAKNLIKELEEDEKWMKEFYEKHGVPNNLIRYIFEDSREMTVMPHHMVSENTFICDIEFNLVL